MCASIIHLSGDAPTYRVAQDTVEIILGQVLTRLTNMERGLGRLLTELLQEGSHTVAAIDDLIAQVERNTTIELSAVALIQGIAAQLEQAADPARVSALTAELRASADALAAAISANTAVSVPPTDPTPA